jgi:hypothetical protein
VLQPEAGRDVVPAEQSVLAHMPVHQRHAGADHQHGNFGVHCAGGDARRGAAGLARFIFLMSEGEQHMNFCAMDGFSRRILDTIASRMSLEEKAVLHMFVDSEKRRSCDYMQMWMQRPRK